MTVAEELRRDWIVLAVAVCSMLVAFSAPAYSLPFIFRSVIDEYGWTREQATLLASIKYGTGAIVSIIVGRLIDKTGVKKMLIAVTLCGAFALISFQWTVGLASYYASGFLLGISTPGTMVAMKVLISRTFNVAQGTAMGLTFIGASVGAVLVPVIVATLIESQGWRSAFAYLSTGVWLVALPLMIFGLREKHLDKRNDDTEDVIRGTGEPFSILDLARERRFWLILFVLSTVGMVDQAMIQHTNLYLELDLGFEPLTVAWAISGFGVAGIFGRFALGITFDRFSTRGVAFGYLILALSLLLALPIVGTTMLLVFATFRGIGHAAVLMDSPIFAKHCYGRRHLGLLIGIFTAVINAGFALGPWIMARMFEMYGTYVPSFVLFSGLALLCSVITMTIEPSCWLAFQNRQVKAATTH